MQLAQFNMPAAGLVMQSQDATVQRLIREAKEAYVEEVLLKAVGEEALERARVVTGAIEQEVKRVTEQSSVRTDGALNLPNQGVQ
jgi:hypothetical protein